MSFAQLRLIVVLLGAVLGLTACAHNKNPSKYNDHSALTAVINYYDDLPVEHPHRMETFLAIPDEAKHIVKEQFSHINKRSSVSELAQWLMSDENHDMTYDINANLRPAESFLERRGNCLSFTLLLVQLSKELDIKLKINQVDLPDMWGIGEDENLILYRHVNAIQRVTDSTRVYDLAIEDYSPGFPQRILSEQQGVALLFSNNGVQFMQDNDLNSAFHYLKLAVSLFPENSDMWVNLGAAYKQSNQDRMAELSYLLAFELSNTNSLAASNLDRLYRAIGKPQKAQKYFKLAKRARLKNPYVRFNYAQQAFAKKQYKQAFKEIKHAIRLHDKDPHFFELSSRIKQTQNKYISALKDLEIAHKLSLQENERERYALKVEMVLDRVKAQVLAASELKNERQIEQLRSEIERYDN